MDEYTKKIDEFEAKTKETNAISDKLDAEIRDIGKKVQKYESSMEETLEKLQTSVSKLEIAEKEFKDKDDEVGTLSRRIMLIEEEGRISEEKMANTVLKLAIMSKEADTIVKGCRFWESKVMNNEVDLEDVDKNLRDAKRMCKISVEIARCYKSIYFPGAYNETKSDNISRTLAMMEDELKRTEERVVLAEARVVDVEADLQNIGENQKQLEVSEEKARQREERYQVDLSVRLSGSLS